MRTSTYEIILPLIGKDDKEIEGKALLVNGLYGAIDVVDSEIAAKIREEDFAAIPFAMRERLTQRGHITRKDEAGELADARLLGRIWTKLIGHSGRGPVILPTYNCNFRCPYCFERHRLTRGQEWLGREMTPEMVEAVFAAFQKQREQGHKIMNCALYGGEPLLKENMATVRNICEHARDMGLTLTAITNGYDLDAYIGLLEEFRFTRLQITVDGVGEMNDRRRLHRDGVPTYDRILRNVALALDHGVDISLRVNVNGDNIGGVKALIEDLAARGLREVRREERAQIERERQEAEQAGKPVPKRKGLFSYYFKAVSEDKNSPTKVTEQQVLDAIVAAGIPPLDAIEKQSQYSMPMQGLYAAMKKEDFPSFSPAFCGSEQGMLAIGPDGLIYPCWDLVAMEEEAVGFIDEAAGRFFFNFGKAKWRTRTSDLMKPCQTCPYIFICRGGCAPEAKRVHGSYFRENCGEAKEIFAYVAPRVVGKKWEETQEEELSVSLAGPLSRFTEAERETLMTTTSTKIMFNLISEAGVLPATADKKVDKEIK
ncbi:MAG: radical SAM protein [Acidaminococcaceae bacterium]|nr:radical SAM protein [Acidaminococcaceae bacterium]